jgi:uncharacterized protein
MTLPEQLTPNSLRPLVEARMTADAAHDWHHIERVFRNGLAIAATEPDVDPVVLRAALLLHDVGEKRFGHGNAVVTAEEVADLLAPFEVPAEALPAIVTAINEHSFTRGARPSTLEAAIVQDADRLDAIGAIGVARAFAYGGANSRPLYDPDDLTNSIQHFHDKLFRLKERMNTRDGRRLAEARHAFMERFVVEFMQEWNGEA